MIDTRKDRLLSVIRKSSKTNNVTLRYRGHPIGGLCHRLNTRRCTFARVSKERICGFTIHAIPGTIDRTLRRTRLPVRSMGCFLLRRTGVQVVRSITGHLRRPVRGFPYGLRGCKGISTTDMPVLLSGIRGRNVVDKNSGVMLTKFNTKLA